MLNHWYQVETICLIIILVYCFYHVKININQPPLQIKMTILGKCIELFFSFFGQDLILELFSHLMFSTINVHCFFFLSVNFIVYEDDEKEWFLNLSVVLTSFYDGQLLITYITSMSSNTDNGGKKNKIVIVSAVVAGLICIGILIWLVWRFKAKLKGKIFILLNFFFSLMDDKGIRCCFWC